MSDSGDFRGSRDEKRQDETVMINKDQMADIVNEAKAAPAAAASSSSEDELASTNFGRIIVILGILAIIIAVAILVYGRITG